MYRAAPQKAQWLSTESCPERPRERTHLAMQGQPGGPGVWSRCGHNGHCQHLSSSGWSPSKSSLSRLTPHHSLALDLGQTGPGRGQPRSQGAAQLPQFLQPQHPDPQPQPTPHQSLALDLRPTQQRKGGNFGLLLSRNMWLVSMLKPALVPILESHSLHREAPT